LAFGIRTGGDSASFFKLKRTGTISLSPREDVSLIEKNFELKVYLLARETESIKMPKRGKKYLDARKKVDREKLYPVIDAFNLVKECSYVKFDENVDAAIRLGVDPKHADQQVRGTFILPHGTGKTVRVIVFAKGDKEKEARDAGADFVGAEDLAEKIEGGWLDFDKAIATPDMMRIVGKLGKILGPRGMMPNPKVGTVTMDIANTVRETKSGKVEFRVDKVGNIHVGIGKVSFGAEKLRDNFAALIDALLRHKPTTSKGHYFVSAALSSTMGPGIKLDAAEIREIQKNA
jgi:large subunit ribosomal protein L1